MFVIYVELDRGLMNQSLWLKLLFLVQSTMTKNAKQPQNDAGEERTTKKCKIATKVHKTTTKRVKMTESEGGK